MQIQKTIGLLCFLAGMQACLAGTESFLQADDEPLCNMSEAITPAKCVPAHQQPPRANPFEPDDKSGCINYYYLWCWPDPETGCWTAGYGEVIPGNCMYQLDEAVSGFCFNEYNETDVVLQYYRSECEFMDGECQCLWIVGGEVALVYTTCNCARIG